MSDGPYTTITVEEFNRLGATMNRLRYQIQKARELLESGFHATALEILKLEDPPQVPPFLSKGYEP